MCLLAVFHAITPAACAEPAEYEAVFLAVADAYVEDVNPTSNYGGRPELEVANSENIVVGEKIAFIMFDLTVLPIDAEVSSAKLRMYTGAFVTETHTIGAFYCWNRTWDELGITYENRPPFEDEPLDTVKVARTDTWYEWNVTKVGVKATWQPEPMWKGVVVLRCISEHETAWVSFYSRDPTYEWMKQFSPPLVVNFVSARIPEVQRPPIELLAAGLILSAAVFLKHRKKGWT